MEINNNLSTNGVNSAVTPAAHRATPSPAMSSDQISLTNFASVSQSLSALPESRSDVVERAQSLIADPNYPSASMMSSLARTLAVGLSFDPQ